MLDCMLSHINIHKSSIDPRDDYLSDIRSLDINA